MSIDSTTSKPETGARTVGVFHAIGERFDFGAVLAGGQTLEHEFLLANDCSHTVRLRSFKAESPCCSSVGAWPAEIAAGSMARVPTRFHPGFQTGRRVVNFFVEADSVIRPKITLTVLASSIAEVDISPIVTPGRPTDALPATLQAIRVTSRRVGNSGRSAPTTLEVAPPLVARFAGKPVEKVLGGGLIESTREAVLSIPEGTVPGRYRLPVTIRWQGGQAWPYYSDWLVAPRVSASPATLIVHESRGRSEFEVILRSRVGPFRIDGIAGDLLCGDATPPANAAMTHKIRIALEPSRGSGKPASDIVFQIDDPGQPSVHVQAIVQPSGG